MKVLDLFSGIGGISLGLERTGGFETVGFCEVEPLPREVLAHRWPGVRIFDDVRTLDIGTLAMTLWRDEQDKGGSGEDSNESFEAEVRRREAALRERPVCGRGGESLRREPASHVGHSEAARDGHARASQGARQLLLPWGGEGESAVPGDVGAGRTQGPGRAAGEVRGVRSVPHVQGREVGGTGAPLGLQPALGGDVAVSALPSRVAPEEPRDTRKEALRELAGIDVVAGGFPIGTMPRHQRSWEGGGN